MHRTYEVLGMKKTIRRIYFVYEYIKKILLRGTEYIRVRRNYPSILVHTSGSAACCKRYCCGTGQRPPRVRHARWMNESSDKKDRVGTSHSSSSGKYYQPLLSRTAVLRYHLLRITRKL